MFERTAAAIVHAGYHFSKIIGFIDAKILQVTRLVTDQRVMYNGYLESHALKFQFFIFPNGIIIYCGGLIEGCRGDFALLDQSDIVEMFAERGRGFNGQQMFIYGDPAYAESGPVLSGLQKVWDLTSEEADFYH